MTNFSTNQVMQFYVHDDGHKLVVDKKFADGSFSMAITTNGAVPTSDGKTTNAIGRTDKIENVMWATLTKAEKLKTPYKKVTLEFKAEVQEVFPNHEIIMDPLSLSVSCHIGPGALAIACSKKVV